MDKLLESELEYLLTNSDAAKFLYYEENWFDKLLNQVLKCKNSMLINKLSWGSLSDGLNQIGGWDVDNEETKEYSQKTSNENISSLNQANDMFESTLQLFLQELWSPDLSQVPCLPSDEQPSKESQDKQPNANDSNISDYARTMLWVDSNIPKGKELAPNTDWCCNK